MAEKSVVWNHCSKLNKDQAECKNCKAIISCKGGNTTGLLNHLKKHGLFFPKTPEKLIEEKAENPSKRTKKESKSTTNANSSNIYEQDTLRSILSNYAAVDGFSINAIKNSKGINEHLKYKNLRMPDSNATITKYILQYSNERKEQVVKDLEEIKFEGGRFSISIDEWCDIVNRRYMNITIHSRFRDYVLGLFPMIGSFNSQATVDLVESSLEKFKLVLKTDIVASVNDGAAVMVKYGRLIDSLSQLCYNHGIHLAVIKIFYTSMPASFEDEYIENDAELFNEYEDYTNENSIFLNDEKSESFTVIRPSLFDFIKVTRKVILFFKKSPLRLSVLHKYVKDQEGEPLNLLLDCKTRWNSLIPMIDRFLLLQEPLNAALKELGQEHVAKHYFIALEHLFNLLNPAYLVVLELGKAEANLLTAEGSLIFVLNKLNAEISALGIEFFSRMKEELSKRRNINLVSLLYFLHNGSYPTSNDNLKYSSKDEIIQFAERVFIRLFPMNSKESPPRLDIEAIISPTLSDKDELKNTINSVMHATKNPENSQIKMDLLNLELPGAKRSDRLEKLYLSLLTIKPTSIASERVFSVSGITITKLRNRMSSELLDVLVFLRYDFIARKK